MGRWLRHKRIGNVGPRILASALWPVAITVAVTGCGSSPATGSTSAPSHTSSDSAATASAVPALPSAGAVVATIPSLGALTQPDDYYGIAADGTSVWLYNGETGEVTRVAEQTGAVSAKIQLTHGCKAGRGCGNVAVGEGGVWIANDVDDTVTHIDPGSNKVVATIHVGGGPQVYATPGAVWSANYFGDSYTRIDPRSNAVMATLGDHSRAAAVAYVAGSVWLCDAGGDPGLTRLDPGTSSVQAQVKLTSAGASVFCLDAVPLGSSLYVATDATDTASPPQVVDPRTEHATETMATPGDAHVERALIGSATRTWLVDAKLGLFRLDAATGRASAQLALDGGAGVADDGQSVWVVSSAGSLYRIAPTTGST
jgi:YVTN family beta-propeller protein